MDSFEIGNTKIPMTTKINKRLKTRRLSVGHNGILVEIPISQASADVTDFLSSRVGWIFSKWNDLAITPMSSPWPERFVSGSKILYLGRFEPMNVSEGSQNTMSYSTSGFDIKVESSKIGDQRSSCIRNMFIEKFSQTVLSLARLIANDLQKFKIIKREDRWAFCDQSNLIHLGWDIAFLPKKLIEYIVYHELAHLCHRNHGEAFWAELKSTVPDFELRAKTLKEFEELYYI